MKEITPILAVLIGTGFTFLSTALGAAFVFFFKHDVKPNIQRVFLGFAAGIMIAASVWSLLIPAINMAEEQGKIGWIPAAGGFLLGGAFLLLLDTILPHLHATSESPEGMSSSLKRTTMLVLAVTMHNIPEGMAVGLAFGLAANGDATVTLASAMVLALGIGLQNLPEGAAISLPLKKEGLSNTKAFTFGVLSGIVEPIGGIIAFLLTASIQGIMPWFLAFAAGAMIYVVAEELIPEANLGDHSNAGTIGVMAGFIIMMILDVALG
ncbi:ZIP family metal transporter [Clostridium botulinum]|uniref:ZIP family metal transporter n=1 Tax=unclassified Clostridium TaxID=2614128 RepID=UPI001D9C932E|nr:MULTISPECIES: ZIP family metal transporter [unclassified Clostridium]MBN1043889.1 ZIP family metal transporter [Clostridium botulinum]MBN1050566.1 ZIP family metal transporter [Clostridium botulinum]